MNDKHIDQLLDDLLEQPIPESDAALKSDAIAMAKKEFSQGFETEARPIGNRDNWLSRLTDSIRSFFMNTINNRMIYSAFGTAAIAFVAVSVVFMMPSTQSPRDIEGLIGRTKNGDVELNTATSQVKQPQPIESKVERIDELETFADVRTNNEAALDTDDSPQVVTGRAQNIKGVAVAKPDTIKATSIDKSNAKPDNTNIAGAVNKDQKKEQETARLLESVKNGSLQKTAAPKETDAGSVTYSTGYSAQDMSALSAPSPSNNKQVGATSVAGVIAENPVSTPMQQAPVINRNVGLEEIVVTRKESRGKPYDLETVARERNKQRRLQRKTEREAAQVRVQQRLDAAEEYAKYQANSIKLVSEEPVSTFSVDVDTASYSLVRNQLNNGYLPKPQAVRAEELINYFDYNYPAPSSKKTPFEPTVSVLNSPWNKGKKLVHIGIKGYEIPAAQQPDSNLVFLLDVSGSMSSANKLPLVKQSINLLLDTLKPTDTVSIVVYAGAAGTVLEPTKASEKNKIISALQRLNAGGSTAGSAGIQLAYEIAEQNFNKDAVNRIILATDGDFNVGQRSNEDLKTLVERKRDNGVFLSVLGFGRNNYQDDMMQTLAQNGNGIAAYIDTLSEAKKVLVDEATSTLFPIAKDVKIQIEFNPQTVSEYRLIGYETRHLNREDFNNDKVDAGDIGAGHTVTAIYEITPANAENQSIDEPRYAGNKADITNEEQTRGINNEFGFLKMRYKLPNESKSKLIQQPIRMVKQDTDSDTQFSVAVAGFAQLLAGSKLIGDLSYDDVINTASTSKGEDPFGYRSEFIQLARMAKIAKP